MRDIKPQQPNRKNLPPRKPPGELPPEVQQLYQKRRSSKKPLGKPIDNLAVFPKSSTPELPPNVPVPKKNPDGSSHKKPQFGGSKVDVAQVKVPSAATSPPTVPPPNSPSAVRAADRAELEAFKQTLRAKRAERRTKQSMPVPAVPQRKHKSTGRPRLAHKERRTAVILILLVLAAGGLAAVIFLPKADIMLTLETAPLLVDQKLTLSSSGEVGEDTISVVPFHEEVLAEGVSAVASREVVGQKAAGVVSIVNRTVDEQKIVEQSRLVTQDGILFYMQKHAIVPPNSSVTVPVEAAEAGPEGNVDSGRLNFAALDSSAQSLVYAEVTQPITSGSGSEVAVVKEADLARATEEAAQSARHQVEEKIRAGLQEGWAVLDESWDMQVVSFDSPAQVDEQLNSLTYSATVAVRVLAYQPIELEGRLNQTLQSRLDENHMLFPGPITFTKSVDDVNWDTAGGQMTVRVTHTTIPTFSLDTLKDKIAGRKQAEAQAYLEGLPGVQSVSLELKPFWVKSIPRISQRIDLELRSDR